MSGRPCRAVRFVGLPLGCSACIGASGGRPVARHAHRSHVVTVAVGGARRLEFVRGVWVALGVGAVAVIPAGTVHAADAAIPPAGGRAVSLSIPPRLLPGLDRGVVLADAADLAETIHELARMGAEANRDERMLTQMLREVLARLGRLAEATAPLLPSSHPLEDAARRLARLRGLRGTGARHHGARRFREAVGLSPSAWCALSRVRGACDRISQGESLADAAVAAGFYDQSQMTRQFLKYLGMTPGDYRGGSTETRRTGEACCERDTGIHHQDAVI